MPDAAHPARSQLHAPALSLDVARLLEHLSQLPKLIEGLPRLITKELLRQRAIDIVRPEAATLELRLEAVHLLQALHQAHRLAHAQRVLSEERVALAQLRGRHHRLHEARQSRELQSKRVVLQQRVHHLTELLASFGAHALEE